MHSFRRRQGCECDLYELSLQIINTARKEGWCGVVRFVSGGCGKVLLCVWGRGDGHARIGALFLLFGRFDNVWKELECTFLH